MDCVGCRGRTVRHVHGAVQPTWQLADGRFWSRAANCAPQRRPARSSTPTRTPLASRCRLLFATHKDEVSALSLRRILEIARTRRRGRCRTGRGRYRCRPAGTGSRTRSRSTRPTSVARSQVFVAGEPRATSRWSASPSNASTPRGSAVPAWRSSPTPPKRRFARASPTHVEPGSTAVTDGPRSYRPGRRRPLWTRADHRSRAEAAGAHRVASLCKRWLLGTHHGSMRRPGRLTSTRSCSGSAYRFNRMPPAAQDCTSIACSNRPSTHDTVRYLDPVANREPKAIPPRPPAFLRRAVVHDSATATLATTTIHKVRRRGSGYGREVTSSLTSSGTASGSAGRPFRAKPNGRCGSGRSYPSGRSDHAGRYTAAAPVRLNGVSE